MPIKKTLLALAAALLLPVSLFCEEWVIPRTTYYITAEQQQLPDFPAPPEAGSKKDKADLAALREWQLKRTPEDCARANAGAHAGYEEFFGDLSPFPRPLPPAASAILKRVKTETDGAAADIKDMFKRPRPFLRDAALEPCLGRIGGLAYPSGHATISRLFALLLADLVPSRKKEFFARADAAALDRVIGGVHHPSDIKAGKRLAEKLYRRYKKSPAFRADMAALRELLAKEAAAR
ncbi:MAG: hypothetical protein A2X35_09575 [Elusimicrobia bacterium GWA2_61_42]|nr:MAG: hypothetical protein A2X35_09575 [Elusimicrobia bacterium GWA2_61_42]OGR79683.1 MAG: hypothetical protein A2X38_07100 [Elusimicrobia bacterium GWC2_61_25]